MTDDPIVPDPTDPLDAEIADLLGSQAPDAELVPPGPPEGQETPQDATDGDGSPSLAWIIGQTIGKFLEPTSAALKIWELPTKPGTTGRVFLAVSFGPNGAFGVYFDEPGLDAHWRDVGALLGKTPEGLTVADMNDLRLLGGGGSPLG